jgi:hypothetical protein
MWADRSRDKLRLTTDWIPDEQWSVQFLADFSNDVYSGRNLGPRQGNTQFFSGDATYAISDKWSLTTWLSRESMLARQAQRSDQVVPSNSSALGYDPTRYNILWEADLRNTTTAMGISLKSKLRAT